MILFSIIIPVYNAERYLDDCVKSVLQQSYPHFELLLINDGSLDKSQQQCDCWAEKDERIRVFYQQNQGAASARNYGIGQATGDYLLFLDADDWWKNDTVLQTIASRLEKTGADVLSFNFQKAYGTELTAPYFRTDGFPQQLTEEESVQCVREHDVWISSPCNKAIKTTLVLEQNILFKPGITAEDIDWCFRIAIAVRRFDYLENVVFVYRQHENSVSHTGNAQKTGCLLQNIAICTKLLESVGANSEKHRMLKQYIAYQYGTLLYSIAALSDLGEQKKLMNQAKPMLDLLGNSEHKKIQLLNAARKVVGLRGAICLLRVIQVLRR